MADMEELHNECVESLFNCVDNMQKYLNPDERSAELNKLQILVKEYCVLDYQRQVSKKALEQTVTGLSADQLPMLDTNFDTNLKKLMSKQPKPANHPTYIRFITKTTEVENDEELDMSEIITTVATEQYIDAITQKQIVSPVRNRKCNHVYEKSIRELIKKRPRTKCPIVGCKNREFLTQADLVNDENLKIHLSQMQHEERDPLADSD